MEKLVFYDVFFKVISDCYDIYKAGMQLPGVYNVGKLTRPVLCLENGWTTIQHRGQYGNPKDFFEKSWEEYVEGFGIPGINVSYLAHQIKQTITKL